MSTVKLKFFVESYYNGNGEMKSVKFNRDGVSALDEVENVTVKLWAGATLVESSVGLLKTNGEVSAEFSHSGDYVISVATKNALEVFTPSALTVGASPLEYDFTVAASQAFGSNQIEVETGVFALYSGDINQDGVINEADRALWETDADNAEFGDFATDLDGSGAVDNGDFTVWEPNVGKVVMRP